MDEIQLRKALAKLRSFADNLPKRRIAERYVNMYHSILTDIQTEIGQDLEYFHIPSAEVKKRWTGSVGDQDFYTDETFCDVEMFMINLNGALNFIASLLEQPGRRLIGFA